MIKSTTHFFGLFCVMIVVASMACNNSKTQRSIAEDRPEINSIDSVKEVVYLVDTVSINSAQYLPVGHVVWDSLSGDLNKDGVDDVVFITKKVDPENTVLDEYEVQVDRNRRGLLIFLSTPKGYRLACQNVDCFSSENEDGGVYFPPELALEIRNNKLYIDYQHGRYGAWYYTFRYQSGQFICIGFDNSQKYGPVVEQTTSINFLTPKKQVKTNTNQSAQENGEEVFTVQWKNLEPTTLKVLSDIEDFDGLFF